MSAEENVRPGQVYKGEVRFEDGNAKEKYVVVLSFPELGVVLVALTTSKGAFNYDDLKTDSACDTPAHRFYRLAPADARMFMVTTWVEFEQARSVGAKQLLNRMALIGALSPDKTRSVLKCAEDSEDLEILEIARVKRARDRLNEESRPKVTPPPAPKTHWDKLKSAATNKPEKLKEAADLLGCASIEALQKRLTAPLSQEDRAELDVCLGLLGLTLQE